MEKHNDGKCQLSDTKCRSLDLLYAIYMGILTEKSHFCAPLRCIFEASVHFKVERSSSRLC